MVNGKKSVACRFSEPAKASGKSASTLAKPNIGVFRNKLGFKSKAKAKAKTTAKAKGKPKAKGKGKPKAKAKAKAKPTTEIDDDGDDEEDAVEQDPRGDAITEMAKREEERCHRMCQTGHDKLRGFYHVNADKIHRLEDEARGVKSKGCARFSSYLSILSSVWGVKHLAGIKTLTRQDAYAVLRQARDLHDDRMLTENS